MKLTKAEAKALQVAAKVLLETAERRERRGMCFMVENCLWAIYQDKDGNMTDEGLKRTRLVLAELAEIFKPEQCMRYELWGDLWGFKEVYFGMPRKTRKVEEAQQCRAMAILLFVEMCK